MSVPGYPDPGDDPAQFLRRLGAPKLIAAAVVVVILVVAGVIVVRSRHEFELAPPPPTHKARTPTPSPSGAFPTSFPGMSYDEATRKLTLPGLTTTLPGRPFRKPLVTDTPEIETIADGVQVLYASEFSSGGNTGYYSSVRVGRVFTDLDRGDVAATADEVLKEVVSSYHDPCCKKPTTSHRHEKLRTDGPHRAITVTLDVHFYYQQPRRGHDDSLVLMVSERPGGGYNAWLANMPKKAKTPERKAMQASLDSITIIR